MNDPCALISLTRLPACMRAEPRRARPPPFVQDKSPPVLLNVNRCNIKINSLEHKLPPHTSEEINK